VNEQLVLDLGHRSAHGVENFLVAPCNADAVAWLDRWPGWPAPALALFGPGASGKTHLAHIWKTRSDARWLPANRLSETAPDRIVAEARNVVVDDAGSGVDERTLLHLYNMLAEAKGNLLLTGRTPPARWAVGLADLRSRLNAAPAVAIGRPDDALIGAVLVKLFADRQIHVDGEVLAYVLARMERSFSAARALVEALDRSALAAHRRITIPLAREVMAALEET
jgi:DnaA regulatory inactivator Hda